MAFPLRSHACVARYLCVFAWLAACPAYGQQTALPASSILTQSLSAMIPAGTTLQDITLRGSVEYIADSPNVTGTITFKATNDGSSRIDIILPTRTLSEAVVLADSKFSGQRTTANGTVVPIALHNLFVDQAWFCPALMIQHISSPMWDAVASASVVSGSTTVQEITGSRHVLTGDGFVDEKIKRLSEMNMLFDFSTAYPSFLTYHSHPNHTSTGDGSVVSVSYSDYQTMGGIVIPSHIQKYVNRTLSLDIRITSATINVGLTDSQLSLQ